MTDQELYDTVAAHLLRQNAKSLNLDGHCAYRGENGSKCAAGVLIPDDKYSPRMECMTVYGTIVRGALSCEASQLSLLRNLQVCHDCHEPDEWPDELAGIAADFNLQPYARPVAE